MRNDLDFNLVNPNGLKVDGNDSSLRQVLYRISVGSSFVVVVCEERIQIACGCESGACEK